MPEFIPTHSAPDALGAVDPPLDDFTAAYLVAAEWTSEPDAMPDDPESIEWREAEGWSPAAIKSAREDCADFQKANAEALAAAYASEAVAYSEERAGHDFWLTRNGHGAGFWDRGLGEVGETLAAAARVYGSSDAYVGDDSQLYFS